MKKYFRRLTLAGKFRYTLASIVCIPPRSILLATVSMGNLAEYLSEAIDSYGKLFINWGRTKAQREWENN